MSAPIAPAKKKAIQQRRLAGERMKDIATAENVSESTVRRVCPDVDAGVELFDSPATKLTEEDIAVLKVLTAAHMVVPCPTCGRKSLAPRGARQGGCPFCKETWTAHTEAVVAPAPAPSHAALDTLQPESGRARRPGGAR